MNKVSILFFLVFAIHSSCFSQDTIRVEPSIYYSSSDEPTLGKEFHFRVRYAREDIVYSSFHKRIEYCYYYDKERKCFGTTYQLINDTSLSIDGIVWKCIKAGDKYFLERFFNGTYESGYATSLIPLKTTGLFFTTTADKVDTLWSTDYSADSPSNRFDNPRWVFYKTSINGKVFKQTEVDILPKTENGESLKPIFLGRKDACYNEPLVYVSELKFIITKEGRIVNIQQSKGNVDLENCPYYMMDLIRYLVQLGKIHPAQKNGVNVNAWYTLKVEMRE